MAEDMNRFGALPPELRNVIYEMLVRTVPENDHIELRIVEGVVRSSCLRKGPKPRDPSVNRPKKRSGKRRRKPQGEPPAKRPETPFPALLSVSKTIRSEALPLYYDLNAHTMYSAMKDLHIASDWLAKTVRLCTRLPRPFVFTLVDSSWMNFRQILPLAKVARDPGFIDAEGNQVTLSLVTEQGGTRLMIAMDDAIALDRQANAAGTSAQVFEQQFEQWVTTVKQRPWFRKRLRQAESEDCTQEERDWLKKNATRMVDSRVRQRRDGR